MKKFDADKRADEGSLEVTIGGKEFTAREPTLAVMKEVAAAVPDDSKLERNEKGELVDPRSEAEQIQESIDSIFPQLQVVLRDASGKPPKKDFIEKNLSMKQAGELIAELMGEGAKESSPR